jgi:hypothetical protein
LGERHAGSVKVVGSSPSSSTKEIKMDAESFDIRPTLTMRVPDHQVLISFNNDEDAEQFEYWFHSVGKQKFLEWCKIPDYK